MARELGRDCELYLVQFSAMSYAFVECTSKQDLFMYLAKCMGYVYKICPPHAVISGIFLANFYSPLHSGSSHANTSLLPDIPETKTFEKVCRICHSSI